MLNEISIPVAFFGGVVSFFAPCVLPLLPAYISYVTGVSLKDLEKKGIKPFRKKLAISSVLYILGFSLVFVILGTSAAGLGVSLRRHAIEIQKIGGAIIILFGLEFAGFVNIPALGHQHALTVPKWSKKLGEFRSFLIGIIFAITWSPCVGAILGSILALAAVSNTVYQGAFLLFVYSIGISAPFLLISFTLASSPKYLKKLTSKMHIITQSTGIILIILGILLVTNTYKYLNGWLFNFAFKLGYQIN